MKIVGVDEVGRGPLAGPVSVCATSCDLRLYSTLKKSKLLPASGKDSKKLNPGEREKYSLILKSLEKVGKISYSITHISNKIIDKRGLSFSIKKAIEMSIKNLNLNPNKTMILLDGGLKAPKEFRKQMTIIKGDEKEKIISWASILAKVSRDSFMKNVSKKFPEYGFHLHKGYGTKRHLEMIKKFGLTEIHRLSFRLSTDRY